MARLIAAPETEFEKGMQMENGKVVKLVADKGFGFIKAGEGKQYFFHKSMLSDPKLWTELSVGQSVEFTPGRSKKGLEATQITLAQPSQPAPDLDSLTGRYGTIAITRGLYSNPEKNLVDCDGLAFSGVKTFGGRFPNNHKLIGMLREMRAIFDRENKFWFLRAPLVQANGDRLAALIKEAKRQRRNQIITNCVVAVLGAIVVYQIGALLIGGALLLLIGGALGGGGRAKMSSTGNIWVGGSRIT